MITDFALKTEFIVNVLNRDMQNIYKSQLLIAQEKIYHQGSELKRVQRKGKKIGVRTGQLLAALQSPDYYIKPGKDTLTVESNIPLQLRFLDMKRLGNWRIYNRQVWGILYRNALMDIKYGYGKELRDRVGEALKEAFAYAESKNANSKIKIK